MSYPIINLERIKIDVKRVKRAQGLSQAAAQESVARDNGFKNWHALTEAYKAQQEALSATENSTETAGKCQKAVTPNVPSWEVFYGDEDDEVRARALGTYTIAVDNDLADAGTLRIRLRRDNDPSRFAAEFFVVINEGLPTIYLGYPGNETRLQVIAAPDGLYVESDYPEIKEHAYRDAGPRKGPGTQIGSYLRYYDLNLTSTGNPQDERGNAS